MRRCSAGTFCLRLLVWLAFNVAVAGTVPLISLNVAANTDPAYLVTYPQGAAVPPTSVINMTTGDWISNLTLTSTASSSITARRGNSPGTTTVRVVQLGYFS